MKIAIDIRLLAQGGTTGIPGYTKELIDSLLRFHPEHEYILFYNAFTKQPLPPQWRRAYNVTIVEKTIPNRLLNASFRLFNRPHFAIFSEADVIFSPHFNLLPRTKTPRVITFHDLSFLHYPQFFSMQQKIWHWMQESKQQAQNAARLIAVSQTTKDDLMHFYTIPEKNISIIYSGIGSEFKKLATDNQDLKLFKRRRSLEKPYILYLGTLESRKNLPLIIRGFSQLITRPGYSQYQLLLAGRPGFGYDQIKKEIACSAIPAAIRELGPVADEERVYLYNAARACVFPSFFEGFGFPPLEAQACQTPVISSNRTSLHEILSDSVVTVNPWKPAELTEAIIRLESDASFRNKIITSGIKNAQRFTWKQAAQQLMDAFKCVS